MHSKPKPLALIILDGWGERQEDAHNPLRQVSIPTFDRLYANHPHTLLEASGKAVGLPEGQMGNSEVGHLHIGAGRKVPQDLTRIDVAIENGEFFKNPILLDALQTAKERKSAVHILGLPSPGGVHSQLNHIVAMITMTAKTGITQHYLHAILDGRDTPPQSALTSLQRIDALHRQLGHGKIVSLIGRYYAMDRDQRWERTKKAYDLIAEGRSDYHAETAELALMNAYARGEKDEFVKPTTIHNPDESPITIQSGDVVIFMNFRADRARQLSHALIDNAFNHFDRNKKPLLSCYVTLTEYDKLLDAKVAFTPIDLKNTLGEFLSKHHQRQLRIAETEKYAHVTYFLNGGVEQPYPLEERILIPSPKIATYDLKPEMSAIELTDQLVKAIQSQQYDVIVCNYANPDMIGHTGIELAAHKAVTTIDHCMDRVIQTLQQVGGEALITADHGNIECMYDDTHHQPHTAHTTNPVPLLYVGRTAHFTQPMGSLDDVAPTLLYLMGLKPPSEMTGKNLLKLNSGSSQ